MLCIASDITLAARRGSRGPAGSGLRDQGGLRPTDLTGIANRRYVTAMIEEMLGQAARVDGTAGCVAVLDLDNFKYINDRYGHHVGDVVLRDFARRILAQVRRTDCFGRVGGEEFVLVLPGTSAAQAALLRQSGC